MSFIRGRALDVFEAFDREAEAALSKAVSGWVGRGRARSGPRA